ncbi:MAG TPA: lipocalin-like domain-containing protein [Roseomonas sp.]
MNAAIGAATRSVAPADLLGTWELVSVKRTATETEETTDQFGPAPRGYLTYGHDGRMMVLFVDSRRPRPVGVAATDAERADLHRSMCAYAGTYALDGQRIVHRIEVSWNEVWSDTEEVRNVGIDGEGRLVVWTDPKPSITDGSMGVAILTWRRPAG